MIYVQLVYIQFPLQLTGKIIAGTGVGLLDVEIDEPTGINTPVENDRVAEAAPSTKAECSSVF